jgi:methyl-accepting chemotaxis protein
MIFNKRFKEQLSVLGEKLSSLEQVRESLDSEMLALTLDPQGRIAYVNTNFQQEMSYPGDQLVGRMLVELVPTYAQKTEHFNRMKNAIRDGVHWAGALQYRGLVASHPATSERQQRSDHTLLRLCE